MPSESIVRFANVWKSYDGVHAVVQNLNLDVLRGEFLTLLGPSGSGKTTTLMMLAGFEDPTAGTIFLDDTSLAAVPAHRRELGMVFQNYALFPHMTVAANVAFPLRVRKMSRAGIQERVEKALDMVALSGYAQRRPTQLSGGQQQRVALARALVFEPQLVLMDEPLGALDKNLREQMQYEIKHLHESLGITFVYVTHDQNEALSMSDRVAVFHGGRIQQLATPAALYETPENAFVAGFIGENNTFSGTVVECVDSDSCIVELANQYRMHATRAGGSERGTQVRVSLRPERVRVTPPDGTAGNEFDARILELIYLGDHIRVRAAVCGTEQFIIKVPNSAAHAELVANDVVRVGWNAEDCRALADTVAHD